MHHALTAEVKNKVQTSQQADKNEMENLFFGDLWGFLVKHWGFFTTSIPSLWASGKQRTIELVPLVLPQVIKQNIATDQPPI